MRDLERYSIMRITVLSRLFPRRAMLGAALLAAGSLSGPLMAGNASAAISYCRTDPIVTFTNGTQVALEADVAANPDDILGIAYVLRAPAGSQVASIAYDPAFAGRETVFVLPFGSRLSYDSSTLVMTLHRVPVSATTTVSGLGSGSDNGSSDSPITVHVAG
jgi:hypothetical protein